MQKVTDSGGGVEGRVALQEEGDGGQEHEVVGRERACQRQRQRRAEPPPLLWYMELRACAPGIQVMSSRRSTWL